MKELSRTNHGNLVVVVYEAEETQEFEFMKWYKHDSGWIGLYQGREDNIGFDHEGNYVDNIKMAKKSLLEWRPANMENVEKLMIIETEKRGFEEGVRFRSPILTYSEEYFDVISSSFIFYSPNKDQDRSIYCLNAKTKNDEFDDICIWTSTEGWAEIVEPFFVNSLGEKFYKGDMYYCVRKVDNVMCGPFFNSDHKEGKIMTEAMTKQSAEEYIKKNKKFEECTHYQAVYNNEKCYAYYIDESCGFLCSLTNDYHKASDFDSIGGKIEF